MTLLNVFEVLNYGLVLLFGLFLSTFIAGGWHTAKQRRLIFLLCPVLLAAQALCWLLWGTQVVEQLYPFIVHLPLVLLLVLGLKKPFGVSLVSVCTAYLLCQLPRWVDLSVTAIFASPLAGQLCYTAAIVLLFGVLCRWFVRAAHDAMTESRQSLLLFGSLPLVYYLFDYATAVYSHALYEKIPSLIEFLPTALIAFYVLFLTAYHAQARHRMQAQLEASRLEAQLRQSRTEMDALRRAETQVAIYQHDIRHHLNMIGSYLAADKPQQALAYIQKVEEDVSAITPRHFCENEAVNLLCSSFADRARQAGATLTAKVNLPRALSLSDTELCSILSNGLENALRAVSAPEVSDKTIRLYCDIRLNKLLMEIKNPYSGEIAMENGIPVSAREGHGYGCRSIHTIAQRLHGLCTFEPQQGLFTLRVVLPL